MSSVIERTPNFATHRVAVIGGGPAGLMAAETLARAGVQVDLYDAMPSVGRKFLMAGKGGMNITHSEPFAEFIGRYGARRELIEPLLRRFDPEALRAWIEGFGIETFVGSSGRVFPAGMKAAPLLRAWLHRLRVAGVRLHVRHRWLGWGAEGGMRFDAPNGELSIKTDAVVFALGGGSWARLGSDGAWVTTFTGAGIEVAPLKPSNCGFDVAWSDYLRVRFVGEPLKTVALEFTDIYGVRHYTQGELMITANGLEGGALYSLSTALREAIEREGVAVVYLDLAPGRSAEQVLEALSRPRGSKSMVNHLRSKLGLRGAKVALLREILSVEDYANPQRLAPAVKALPIRLLSPRPIDEAISTAGGVRFEELDENLMVRQHPGVFCAGEMLDWEAPTGGYLLSACFASGRVAGEGVLAWLKQCMR